MPSRTRPCVTIVGGKVGRCARDAKRLWETTLSPEFGKLGILTYQRSTYVSTTSKVHMLADTQRRGRCDGVECSRYTECMYIDDEVLRSTEAKVCFNDYIHKAKVSREN